MDNQISESSEGCESPQRDTSRKEELPCALGILHQLHKSKSAVPTTSDPSLADEKSYNKTQAAQIYQN